MGKGSGWSILGRKAEAPPQTPVVSPASERAAVGGYVAPPAPVVNRADRAATALTRLPKYFTIKDLTEAFNDPDLLLDAYVQGWLPTEAVTTLESDPAKLQCWLLARVIRMGL